MHFDLPKEKSSIIKVIGVGGGGSNAVNHMFKLGIKDVDFIVCNTDRQVLDSSPVPIRIQLGAALTEGLGAGSLPEMGRKAALENIDELKKILTGAKMLFITAGMGGGTGTGAAPVIAQLAREMGILTVSICTLPFSWEGKLRRKQAEEGLMELKKYSDSVLVILNDKLREIYHNLKVSEAFAHADNVLSSAAKCIAELINVALRINVDFNDVRRVMESSGVAIMGSAMGAGEGRALKAVTEALNSPLLNDNDIRGARYVLASITCGIGKDELTMDELAEITDYIQEAAGQTAEMIKGYGTDESLGDRVSVTIIASGFDRKATDLGLTIAEAQPQVKMLHLEDTKPLIQKKEKIEISKITEPTLKSNVVPEVSKQKQESNATPVISEMKDEPSKIELKKQEEKPAEPKHIELRLDPIAAPVINIVKEEPKTDVVIESKPVAKEEPIIEEFYSPAFTTPEAMGLIEEDKYVSSGDVVEPAAEPFFLVKEKQQISFEFDITTTPSPVLTSDKEPVAIAKHETPISENPVTEFKIESTPQPTPLANMDVKRVFDSPKVTNEPVKSEVPVGSDSKVTKIGEVQLNSLPPISDNDARTKAQEKIQKLRELSFKVKTPGGLAELENEPAYKRKNVALNPNTNSADSEISRFTLNTEDQKPSLRPDNSFLHDKPD